MFGCLAKSRSTVYILAVLVLSFFLHPTRARTGDLYMEIPVFQKGMCFATWEKERFASPYSDQALETLKNLGVEYIQMPVTLYQEKYNSTKIDTNERTPSDKSIKHAIRTAHELGLKVMLKPHIDLISEEDGTYWRADIGFNNDRDWEKWFKEYERVLAHYARIAKECDVEIYCIGTELSFTTQKPDRWREIISSVRKIYPGKLTYAANWDNYKHIEFWEDLDFIGIDAYFPLTYKVNPTVEDIKKGWEKWKMEIESWHMNFNKPIIFTEIGYSSSLNAPREPWKNGEGEANVEIQARCYAAFFETVWKCDWLAGVYWWKWSPSIHGGGEYNRQFTPMNKPAAKILEENYKSRLTVQGEPVPETLPVEAVTPESKAEVTERGIPVLFKSRALLPLSRTKYEPEFRSEWRDRQKEVVHDRQKDQSCIK